MITQSPSRTIDPGGKREAILDAALELFCERGFDGTPVPLVAERAGVGAGTIYRYFESKEALVNAVHRRWKGELKRMLVDECPIGLSTRNEFAHWWRGFWRFATMHPRAFAFLEMHHHAPYLDDECHAIGETIAASAEAFVRRAQVAGDVRIAPPEMLIAVVFGSFIGLMKGMGDAPRFDEAAVAASEECIWAAMRA